LEEEGEEANNGGEDDWLLLTYIIRTSIQLWNLTS
jgi:hypothetical protein